VLTIVINIRAGNECLGVRFCCEAVNGNTPAVSSSRHSKLIGLFHRRSDPQIKLPDRTSLPEHYPISGNECRVQHSEPNSERLPFEVCFVDIL